MTDATTATTAADTTAASTTATDATSTATTTQAASTDASAAASASATTSADTSAAAASATADWRASITDPDAKEFATRLATPADAVKVALDLRKANSSMVRVPGKDATAEDRAKFNKAIGVPETADGYKFELGREATEADKAIQGNLAKIALENGIPATAMTALSKAVSELAGAAKAEENRVAVEGRAASEAALRKEWGADYEANKALAARAVQAFGEISKHPEVLEFFNKTVDGVKIGDHPVMVRMNGNIGRRMGEGEFIGAVGSNERASLQSEMQQLLHANPPGTEAYKAPAVQARIKQINEQLYGNEPAARLG